MSAAVLFVLKQLLQLSDIAGYVQYCYCKTGLLAVEPARCYGEQSESVPGVILVVSDCMTLQC